MLKFTCFDSEPVIPLLSVKLLPKQLSEFSWFCSLPRGQVITLLSLSIFEESPWIFSTVTVIKWHATCTPVTTLEHFILSHLTNYKFWMVACEYHALLWTWNSHCEKCRWSQCRTIQVQDLNNSLVHTFNHPLSVLSNKLSLICLLYIQGWTTANSSIRPWYNLSSSSCEEIGSRSYFCCPGVRIFPFLLSQCQQFCKWQWPILFLHLAARLRVHATAMAM